MDDRTSVCSSQPVRLEGTDGSAVELTVTGYQFPGGLNLPSGRHAEPDWLNVEGRVTTTARAWKWSFPCLWSDEAAELGEWLDGIARGRTEEERIAFTEPNITIVLLDTDQDGVMLRFRFAQEACPPGEPDETRFGDGLPVDLKVQLDVLATAVREWNQEIAPFPARG